MSQNYQHGYRRAATWVEMVEVSLSLFVYLIQQNKYSEVFIFREKRVRILKDNAAPGGERTRLRCDGRSFKSNAIIREEKKQSLVWRSVHCVSSRQNEVGVLPVDPYASA